jgi:GNAT superfamily N-acetyltransferase
MAELYEKPPSAFHIDNSGSNVPQLTGDRATDEQLAGLSDDERKQYLQEANAPLTGEDVAQLVAGARETGYRPNNEEVQLYKGWAAKQNHSILQGIAQGFEGIKQVFFSAGQEFIDHPTETGVKLPASVVEGFFQGGRNLYGMLAESQDPNSHLFKWKNILTGDGSDPDAERKQFIEAMEFNHHTADIEEGKATVIMDKDLINHKVATASSFIADPTLLVPYLGEVTGVAHAISAGMRAVGIGERIAKISAGIGKMQNKIIGGTLKWGIGTPVEFMGGAVRNTIDYGTTQSGRLVEAATGLPMSDWRATVRMSQLGTLGAEAVGIGAVPVIGDISKAHLAGTFAHGAGGAISAVGDQILRQAEFGRGINSFAKQAMLDAEKNGIILTPHAKNLLAVLDKADPLFSYANTVARGSAHGAMIGGTLGYLSGGEEGMAQGIGAGIGLGAIGGINGRLMSDITGGTRNARVDIQAKLAIEGWKQTAPDKATAFQILKAKAEAISPEYANAMNGIIAGVDGVAPNLEAHIMGNKNGEFNNWLKKEGYNPETGHYAELSKMYEGYKIDRKDMYVVNGILRDNGQNFAGDVEGFKKAMADPANQSKFKDRYNALSENAKDALHDALEGHKELITELDKQGTNIKDFYGHHSAAEAVTDQINQYHEQGNMTKVSETIKEFLDANRNPDGTLTKRGELIKDKLRNEGYLDREGNTLQQRGSRNADLTAHEFMSNEGAVIRRESDGKVHMYINTDHLANTKSIVPHELFHAIFRETAMKSEFMGRWLSEILGEKDANGNYTKKGSVDINELKKFFSKYIDIDGSQTDKVSRKAQLDKAIENHQRGIAGEVISDKTVPPLEHFAEEFGAYYYSHWLLSKPNDYLFRGAELTGVRGIMERVKDGWLDYWEGEMKSNNPTFDFSKGVDTAFGEFEEGTFANKRRTRIGSLDYFMRDFTRAVANSNRGTFDPRTMSQEGLKSFVDKNGVYTLGQRDKNGRINPVFNAEYDRANAVAGREIHKILNGLDPKLRTTVVDGEGNITGRMSPDELDAIVKSGHRNRAWADKIKQAYDILDGKGSNVVEYGYFGRTEQIGDYSWPRKTGKDVAFKNRKSILLDVETKIGADGKFYTLFNTLDKAVIEARGDAVWSNPEAKRIWGDRASMEADFFKYLENASKTEGDTSIKTSAQLLEDGSGNGNLKRNFLHQMLGMAMSEGDAYINKPIAEIPYGIRQSVTTYNVDGVSNMRVGNGARYDYNHNNAFKRLSRNWKPSEMTSEKTVNGQIAEHASGYKFVTDASGKVSAYNRSGERIGQYANIQEASKAGQKHYTSATSPQSESRANLAYRQEESKFRTSFKKLEDSEAAMAKVYGDVFKTNTLKDFIGRRQLIPFTRQEYVLNRFLSMDEKQLYDFATKKLNGVNQEVQKQLAKHQEQYDILAQKIDDIHDNDYKKAQNNLNQSLAKQSELGALIHREAGNQAMQDYNSKKITADEFGLHFDKLVKEHPFAKDLKVLDEEYNSNSKAKDLIAKQVEALVQQKSIIMDTIYEVEQKGKSKFERVQNILNTSNSSNNPAGDFHRRINAEFELAKNGSHWQKNRHINIDSLFGDEHDSMFQTGKPFVTVATHGTNNMDFGSHMLFDLTKGGETTKVDSARMGVFFASSKGTSGAYSEPKAFGTINDMLNAHSEIVKEQDSRLTEGKKRRLTDVRVSLTERMERLYKNIYDLKNFEEHKASGETQGYIDARNKFASDRIDSIFRMKTTYDSGDFTREIYNSAKDYKHLDLFDRGMSLDEYQRRHGQILKQRFAVTDEFAVVTRAIDTKNFYEPAKAIVDKHLLNTDVQLRYAIRMNNPKIIFDPKNGNYQEYYLRDHMLKAKAEGHDGVVFQFFKDGGDPDSVFTLLNENVEGNYIGLESTLDDRQLPRGENFKTIRQLDIGFKPIEWTKDLIDKNHAGFVEALASKKIVYANPEDLSKGTAVSIIPDNSAVGTIHSGDKLIFNGQGGVLYSISKNQDAGLWASNKGAASKLAGYINDAIDLDIRKNGMNADGTINPNYKPRVWLTLAKANSDKVLTSENGARGAMNILEKMRDNDIVPAGVFRDAIKKALIATEKETEKKIPINKGLSGDALVEKMHELFFSKETSTFTTRGFFVKNLISSIAEAYKFKDTETQKNQFKDKARVIDDFKKSFGEQYDKGLTVSHMTEAISEMMADPMLKGLKTNDAYGAIKIESKVKIAETTAHESYSHAIVTEDGSQHQLHLLREPRNIRELMNTAEGEPIREKAQVFNEDGTEKLNKKGKKIFKDYTADFGFTSEGAKIVSFKSEQGMQDRTGMSRKPVEEGQQGGRTYDQNSREWKTGFIGRVAYQNQDLTNGISLQHIDKGNGYNKLVFTDNSSGVSKNIGHISWDKFGGMSTSIDKDYRGKGLSKLFYSEAGERMRAQGIENANGFVVNKDAIPIRVREQVFGDTRRYISRTEQGGAIGQAEAKAIIAEMQKQGGEFAGIAVNNRIDKNRWYKPTEYQGGDDYYKPKKNIFESRDEQGLLVRRVSVGNDEITGNPDARGSKTNPDYVGWEDIGHYPQTGKTKADNIWEAKNSGLWYWKDNEGVRMKNPMWESDRPDFTHSEWFDKFKYDDDRPNIYGRYEKPKYDEKGNLVEKGKISISSNYRGEVKDMADANFYKDTVASSLGVPADHIDAYLFGASDKVKSSMGYGLKDQLPIKFKPDESGRTYTPEQFNKEFIGKQAFENKDLTNGIRLSYRGWDKADGKDEGRKLIILTRTADGAEIGRIDFDYEHLTKYGMKGRGFGETDKDGIIVDGINVKVTERFQGMGYQHILYSEMFERARAIGATGFSQSIENKKGLPLKSVNRVIGEADNFIASLTETGAQKPTQENFDRLMANAPSPTGNWMSNEPAVQNWGNINPKEHYKPIEGINDWNSEKTSAGSIIKNSAGYVISQMNGKWRVYNPYKVLVGIFDDEEKAKMRVRRQAIKR